ncbi:MAG: hypothetical protein CBE50_001360 [Flammeovirgaceae bacterium TMED290]|nr:MAG: hypothetical protein CBE50_001360 [Flammeovirgaceae bacterium TMED290]
MKNFTYLKTLFLTLFVSALLFSCSDEEDDTSVDDVVDPLDTQANLLNGSWVVKDANSVTKDGSVVNVFTAMSLTFSGGSASGGAYATLNSDSNEVWPGSGTWQFQSGSSATLLRSDGVVISISVTETTLKTTFSTSGGIKDGTWVFDFVKQ